MKRVLFVDHVDRILGGAEINLIELIEDARSADEWEIAVACRPDSRLGAALRKIKVRQFDHGFRDDLNTLRLAGRGFPWMRAWKAWKALQTASRDLRALIARFEPAAVVSCTNKDHFTAASACQKTAAKSIWWVNDLITSDFFPAPARSAFKACSAKAHALIAVSNCVRTALVQLGLPSAKITVIRNGIPLAKYQRGQRGVFRYRHGLPSDAPLFAVMGRITAWKGQDIFINLARTWIEAHRSGHFAIIGQSFNEDQAQEEPLREMIAESPALRERVHFIPFQDNVAEALTDVDVLFHTSRKPEPFGRVIIEAMAVGVPVIAAEAGGAREIIFHGQNGLLAKVGNEQDYAAKLQALLSDPVFASHLSAAGLRTVRENFTVQRVRHEFEEVIASL